MTESQIDDLRKHIKTAFDNYHCMSGELIACDFLLHEVDRIKAKLDIAMRALHEAADAICSIESLETTK